ncbi:hypothetical protein BDZ90DRAFT_108503 [Jaminaea rosea]|uniref:Uncharacterized protein n=1 Tax=Jaminaea rosea TaxID=1569628 RepID=A0A316UVU8_9BASI|nr:hypothetical protein BDZ90DRAFT_108503 [Jaminaea rosea]PWN29416.1 hypothetical protein BDZ90DRAFT_108503 [Jaminaea rosea]
MPTSCLPAAQAAIGPVLDLLTPLLAKGDVDLLLKLLQTFSALLLSYPSIHGPLLALTLRHCLQLQSNKVQVVSSTAAATVRQAIMIVFEKVVEEDRVLDGIKEGGEDAAVAAPLAAMTTEVPGEENVTLFPSSADAFKAFCDLNALAQDEAADFLELSSLPRTFTLELIESILTNHTALVRNHPELLHTLRESTCPLLIKALSEKPAFPTALRYMRLLFVLLRQFSADLVIETEILVSILLRFVAPSADPQQEAVPKWQRIIALEVTRSLCSDSIFLRNLWAWFDGKDSPAKVFLNLVEVLKAVAEEGGTAIGASRNASVTSPRQSIDRRTSGAFSLYEAAAGVANAMLSGSQDSAIGNLTLSSTPPLQFIDQLEKAEAPNAPATYAYLLGLQSLVHVAQSLAQHILPAYSSFVNARSSGARLAPPRLDFQQVEQKQRRDLLNCKAMVSQSSKTLRSSLFFLLSAQLDDSLFCEVLTAVRNWTNVCGVLGEDEARNSFIAGISSIALPQQLPDDDPSAPEIGLSERNLAALRVLAHVATYLSGILDGHWRPVLAALCDAELLIKRAKGRRENVQGNISQDDDKAAGPMSPRASSSTAVFQPGFSVASTPTDSKTGRPQLLAGLDFDSLLREVANCFENTTSLDGDAFQAFLEALCDLCDASARQAATNSSAPPTMVLSTPTKDRRPSGAATSGQLQRPLRDSVLSGSIYMLNLDTVLRLNVKRLNESSEERGWSQATKVLLDLACDSNVRPVLRTQAAEALAALLLASMGTEHEKAEAEALQRRVFAPLRTVSVLNKDVSQPAVEVRKVGVETLRKILETHGYALRLGWDDIFETAIAACHRPSHDANAARMTLPLVKTAFAATQLICNDLLAALSLDQLLLVIEALQGFGLAEDINVALTASSALWSLTAEIADRSSPSSSTSSSTTAAPDCLPLWLRLLTAFRLIAADGRAEVRDAAISGLFRVLSSYGQMLDSTAWSTALRKEVFPLLDATAAASVAPKSPPAPTIGASEADTASSPSRTRRKSSLSRPSQEDPAAEQAQQWQKTQSVAYEELAPVVSAFLSSRLIAAEDFVELWDTLLAKIKSSFLAGPALVSQASIAALRTILSSQVDAQNDKIRYAWRQAWLTWAGMADSLASAPTTFSHPNLLAFGETFSELYRCQPESVELEAVPRLHLVETYAGSGQGINDVDKLTPVQAATRDILFALNHQPGLPAALLRTIAERISLPFTLLPSASGAQPQQGSSSQRTYIAAHKEAVRDAINLFSKHKHEADTYTSGAFNAVLAALAVPIKLRYDCPQPYRYAPKDLAPPRPLWQEATLAFASMCPGACDFLDEASEQDLPDEDLEGIWRHLLAVYQAAFDGDCSGHEEDQERDGAFDLVILCIFERHVWPVLGSKRTPAAIVEQFAVSLARASRCHEESAALDRDPPQSSSSGQAEVYELNGPKLPSGTVLAPQATSRENLAKACLNMLFLMCSNSLLPGIEDNEERKRRRHRVAALSLPVLLRRVKASLKSYTADAALLGSAPFPRLRDEEAYLILSHLLDLRLQPETLSAAKSGDATQYLEAHYSGEEQQGEATLASLAHRTPLSHLFALHGTLLDVVALSCVASASPVSGRGPLLHHMPQGFDYGDTSLLGGGDLFGGDRRDRGQPRRIADLARDCLNLLSESFE